MIGKTAVSAALAAAALLAATTGGAEAFTRMTQVSGPDGGYSRIATHYCYQGTCYTEAQIVGTYGRAVFSSRQCTKTAPGVFTCQGSLAGSGGGSLSWSGTVTVNE